MLDQGSFPGLLLLLVSWVSLVEEVEKVSEEVSEKAEGEWDEKVEGEGEDVVLSSKVSNFRRKGRDNNDDVESDVAMGDVMWA